MTHELLEDALADRWTRTSVSTAVRYERVSLVPLWFQIANALRQAIESGACTTGQRLDSQRVLCQRFVVSPPTIRQAVRHLVSEGLLTAELGTRRFLVSGATAPNRSGCVRCNGARRADPDRRPAPSPNEGVVMYQPGEEVVASIRDYMNTSQPEALLEIARQRDADCESARMVSLDADGFTLEVSGGVSGQVSQRIQWSAPLRHREDIRAHLTALQNAAHLEELRRRHRRIHRSSSS